MSENNVIPIGCITKESWVGTPVMVDWLDSAGSSGWHNYDHSEVGLGCSTVGHYYAEYKDCIVVALNKSDKHGYGDYITIPRVAIKKVKRLK